MDLPLLQRIGDHPKGLAEGAVAEFYIIRYNNSDINLMLQLLLFLTNRLPPPSKMVAKTASIVDIEFPLYTIRVNTYLRLII